MTADQPPSFDDVVALIRRLPDWRARGEAIGDLVRREAGPKRGERTRLLRRLADALGLDRSSVASMMSVAEWMTEHYPSGMDPDAPAYPISHAIELRRLHGRTPETAARIAPLVFSGALTIGEIRDADLLSRSERMRAEIEQNREPMPNQTARDGSRGEAQSRQDRPTPEPGERGDGFRSATALETGAWNEPARGTRGEGPSADEEPDLGAFAADLMAVMERHVGRIRAFYEAQLSEMPLEAKRQRSSLAGAHEAEPQPSKMRLEAKTQRGSLASARKAEPQISDEELEAKMRAALLGGTGKNEVEGASRERRPHEDPVRPPGTAAGDEEAPDGQDPDRQSIQDGPAPSFTAEQRQRLLAKLKDSFEPTGFDVPGDADAAHIPPGLADFLLYRKGDVFALFLLELFGGATGSRSAMDAAIRAVKAGRFGPVYMIFHERQQVFAQRTVKILHKLGSCEWTAIEARYDEEGHASLRYLDHWNSSVAPEEAASPEPDVVVQPDSQAQPTRNVVKRKEDYA